MTTRQIHFFMTIDEFAEELASIAEQLQLRILVGSGHSLSLVATSTEAIKRACRSTDTINMFLSEAEPPLPLPSLRDAYAFVPAKLGWAQITPPREHDEALFMSNIASKSDWGEMDGMNYDNPAAHKLFAQIRRRFRKLLSYPTEIRWEEDGTRRLDKTIGWSSGAEKWVLSGAELRQRGVPKPKFFPLRALQ